MESKNTIPERLYNLDEIAKILGVSYKTAQNKITKAGIKKTISKRGRSLYLESQVLRLTTQKYYPVKTTEVYYIYESKMNNEK